jgi:hypothetical protein
VTAFPATPRDVATLTLQEFTFRLDLEHSPSLPDVCNRFGDDTNRAVVWLVRFRALQKMKADGRMDRWVRTRSEADRQSLCGDIFEIAATQPLNERWEFDASTFFQAVEALTRAARGSRAS